MKEPDELMYALGYLSGKDPKYAQSLVSYINQLRDRLEKLEDLVEAASWVTSLKYSYISNYPMAVKTKLEKVLEAVNKEKE